MPIRIYFGTNRNPLPTAEAPTSFGRDFCKGRDDLRFGQVIVDDTGKIDDWKVQEIQCLPDVPQDGSKTLLKELKTKMFSQKRPTFVFIHGYNTNWENACKAAANLKKAYGHLDPNVFLFSWPSDGDKGPRDMQEYKNDRLDAEHSGPAIYRGFRKLGAFFENDDAPACGQQVVLWVHSMGNFALSNAIKALIADAPSGGRLPRLFDHIISAAADEDNDAFVKDRGEKGPGAWTRIGELCGEMTIYFNKNDTALWGSEKTKGNPDRMGKHGPSMPFDIPGNVTVVEVSKLDPILDFIGHGYYDTWKEVIDDVTQVLQGTEPHKVKGRNEIPMKNKYSIG